MCATRCAVDDDAELMDGESSTETQLSTYLQLQMQLFESVLTDTTTRVYDDDDVGDLLSRFRTLQDRQLSLIGSIQRSRFAAQQVRAVT